MKHACKRTEYYDLKKGKCVKHTSKGPILAWMGGKTKLKKKIISRMPKDIVDRTYVEPFVGGGSVFFAKPISKKEIINDKDKHLIDFYRKFSNTPCQKVENCKIPNNPGQFHAAVKNMHTSTCSYLGVNKTGYGGKMGRPSINPAQLGVGKNAVNVKTNCEAYKARLNSATVLNTDFRTVLKRYNKKDTFAYLDPPYYKTYTEGYNEGHDLTPKQVCGALRSFKGKFLLSYNNHNAVKEACHGFKQSKVETSYDLGKQAWGNQPKKKVELLISNY